MVNYSQEIDNNPVNKVNHGITTDLLLITFLWCLAAIIINPQGNFPLIDDWQFGKAVKYLLEEGEFRPMGVTTMTLISQVLWGSIFCVPFGFSFTALRVSTLLLSLLGVFGFYLLIRRLGCPRWIVIIAALMLAFNPIYFALSYSFMTDVPFTVLSLFAVLFLVKVLQSDSDIYLLMGAVMAIVATLCRQVGLFIPLAFTIALPIKHGFSFRILLRAGLPLIAAISSMIILRKWLEANDALPYLYNYLQADLLMRLQNPQDTLLLSVLKTHEALLDLGLFLFPLVILIPPVSHSDKWRRGISLGIFLLPAIGYMVRISNIGSGLGLGLMPINGPVFFKGGIGPITLYDTFLLNLPHAPTLPRWFWALVTIISLVGAGLVFTFVVRSAMKVIDSVWKRSNNSRAIPAFFICVAVLYFMPLAVLSFSDRYLIPLIPLLAGLIIWERNEAGARVPKYLPAIGVFVLGLFLVYSIVGTRDYMQLNRVRWDALRYLTEQENVKPSQIDGGFEFNAWYLYRTEDRGKPRKRAWVDDDEYIVALGDIPGYEIFKRYPFYHWMSMQEINVFILKRNQK
ncbi:hypothetical protein C4544_03345 [candidate division WS5 bacterium]|uniref:Glycosyltransferase RgtA/B/C/D-like domain-containing protein n=1 Tax=candidate division WS5 bacterium TaxID=2093353 RepID=A0A419DDX4_9BACT|nr:MAG: hypothetical protein C4544_03345 [candidate division WS5 bacterium]